MMTRALLVILLTAGIGLAKGPDAGLAASNQTKEESSHGDGAAAKEAHPKGEEEGDAEGHEILARTTSSYEELPDGRHQPWRLVRALQRLQDNIAQGSDHSLAAYRILHIRAANWMLEQSDEIWQHERNLDALAVYMLLGGDTQVGYKALQKSHLEDWQKLPLKGALAFAERDYLSAGQALNLVDHTKLPHSIGAQFALAKAMLASSSDLKLAAQLLGEARRMAPSTLVEEAALRRAIRVAGELGDIKQFRRYVSSYRYRFSKSEYFEDFLRNYSFALVRMPKEFQSEVLKDLQALAEELSPQQKISVLSYVARHAVSNARVEMGSWASAQVLNYLKPGSKLYTRMQLYSAASGLVLKNQTMTAMEQLHKVDESRLNEDEARFLTAVNALAKRMTHIPGSTPLPVAASGETRPKIDEAPPTPVRNPVLNRAERLFAELDKVEKHVK